MQKEQVRILLIAAIIPIFVWTCGEKKAKELLEKCEHLEIGMTREQVDSIMGEPISVKEGEFRGRMEMTLVYLSPRVASEFTQCVIDKETGLVIEIRCGEGYLVTEEDYKCARLKKDMTVEQLKEIMGEPAFTWQSEMLGSEEEWLYYVSPRYPRRVTKCLIDKKSGLLMGVYCK